MRAQLSRGSTYRHCVDVIDCKDSFAENMTTLDVLQSTMKRKRFLLADDVTSLCRYHD